MNHDESGDATSAHFDITALPSLPGILLKLLAALHDEHAGARQIAAIIEADIGLSARVVAAAGTGAFGPARPYRSLEHAVLQLGLGTVRMLAVTTAVQSVFERPASDPSALLLRRCWQHSLRTALAARSLARLVGEDEEAAYLAGLLQDIGRLLLAGRHPGYCADLSDTTGIDEWLDTERRHYGIAHDVLAAQLLLRWGFGRLLADAVRYRHRPAGTLTEAHPLVRVLKLANLLATGIAPVTTMTGGDGLFGLSCDLLDQLQHEVLADARALDDAPATSWAGDDATARARLQTELGQILLIDQARQQFADARETQALHAAITAGLCRLFGIGTALLFVSEEDGNLHYADGASAAADLLDGLRIAPGGASVAAAACTHGDLRQGPSAPMPAIVDEQLCGLLGTPAIAALGLRTATRACGVLVFGVEAGGLAAIQARQPGLQCYARAAAAALDTHTATRRRDARERREAADLRAAQVSQLVHEASNPLSVMRNYLAVLDQRLATSGTEVPELDILREEIDRIAGLLRGYADETDRPFAADSPTTDLNRLIREFAAIARVAFLDARDIRLVLELDPLLTPVQTDGAALRQVLLNLLRNAAEALGSGGCVTISTEAAVVTDDAGYVGLRVIDDGPGLPEAVRAQLFRPVASTKGADHAGRGLSIVAALVRQPLNGRISCRSQAGRGCRFEILIPRSSDTPD